MAGADARVLVCICGYVCDEFLGGEGEESAEVGGGCGGWWEPGEGEVVGCYCVWDLFGVC